MKRILLLIFLFCWPVSSWAATPSHDATSTHNPTAQQNPSYTHTRGASCPNPVAIISVGWQDGTPGTLSTVTYGGAGATALHASLSLGAGPAFNSLWIYKNPGSGGATVQANFSESINGITIRTSTYCNVDQTTSTGTVATATGSSTTPSVNVSSATGELVVDASVANADAGSNATSTVGASQTQRANFTVPGNHRHDASEEAGAATVTMSWTLSATKTWGIIGVALKPSADSASTDFFMRRRSGQ